MSEPTIYKPGAYNTPGIYNGAGGIYNGRGVYKDGTGGGGDTVEIGGRLYPFKKVNNLFWITENLDWKFDGLTIGPNGVPITPAAWYFNNNELLYGINGRKCGLLYNGYAVLALENILPNGWRVPTRSDLDNLINYCGGYQTAGKKLKAIDDSILTGFPNGWGGEDTEGMQIIPCGLREGTSFYRDSTRCFLVTSTKPSEGNLYTRDFYPTDNVSQNTSYDSMSNANTVRLCKDA